MRSIFVNALLIGTALTLTACSKESKSEDKAAKGQVVATVHGEDVTVYELNAELEGAAVPSDGDARKKVEQAALQRIVNRKILADIARERKLDKTPAYLLQTRRAEEALLVSMLQRDLAQKLPPVTDEDAEKYVAANPTMFGERKIIMVDQLQFPAPGSVKELETYRPLKTLEEFESKLTQQGLIFRRVPGSFDTAQLPSAHRNFKRSGL